MAHITCSLIITTKNEEKSIAALLESIKAQSKIPDEVIITDAGSTDSTKDIIAKYAKKLPITFIQLNADDNRSVGRNRAIETSTNDVILITDAGCTLDASWVEMILEPFEKQKADVIAGYYRGVGENVFEKCQIPFVLVMPDKYDPASFLPATRSMGIRKSVWKGMGGFNESLRFAEDYIFARQLRERKYVIVAAPKAIVFWKARPTVESFFTMIAQHAQGDVISGAWRTGVFLTFARYIVFYIWFPLLAVYLLYAVYKNYRYVNHPDAYLYLPLLQVVCDFAVMWGTIRGSMVRMSQK